MKPALAALSFCTRALICDTIATRMTRIIKSLLHLFYQLIFIMLFDDDGWRGLMADMMHVDGFAAWALLCDRATRSPLFVFC
jgi:hypothetical protein